MQAADPLESLDVTNEALTTLSRMQERNREGSSINIVTPQFEDVDPDDILNRWKDISSGLEDLTPTLVEIERSNAQKFGPRSIAKDWAERSSATAKYFTGHTGQYVPPQARIAGRFRPKSINDVIQDNIWNDTNSGLPDLKRKGLVKDKFFNHDLLKSELDMKYPAVLFTRTQEGGKTRDVWGYPISDTIWEHSFYQPLLSERKQLFHRAALRGPDEVDIAVTEMFASMGSKQSIVAVDFSAYDQSISGDLQRDAWSRVLEYFQEKHHDELREIALRFRTIGLVTPDGVWNGQHGVPSGSVFTNEIDSLVQENVALSFDPRIVNEKRCNIQGDDGIYVVDDDVIYDFQDNFRAVGLDINSEKSSVSDIETTYLQRYYHPNYSDDFVLRGVYSTFRALNRIVHMERWTNLDGAEISGEDFFAIRAISILENCKHHPWFPELVKYVASFDRMNLAFNKAAVSDYVKLTRSRSGGLAN